MRHLRFIIILLFVCPIAIGGNVKKEKDTHPLQTICSYDSILELARKLSIKIRSQRDTIFIVADVFEGLPHECPWRGRRGRRSFDLLSTKYKRLFFDINEGVVYSFDISGKYFPLFPFGRFRINEWTDSTGFKFSDDTWDDLLDYFGRNIYDYTDQRRHIHDSLALEAQPAYPAVKK